MKHAPNIRVTACNQAPIKKEGARYVLYWMIAHRRLEENFALQHAAAYAESLDLPLLIFEPLRCGYEWASDRIHRFILDGMCDHDTILAEGSFKAHYYPYVEPEHGAGRGLLAALAEHAAIVITDDFPCFFLPNMIRAAGEKLESLQTRLEMVDANGLLPLRAAPKTYTTAYSFRIGLHKILPEHLEVFPARDPLIDLEHALDPSLLEAIEARWPRAQRSLLEHGAIAPLQALPIDHDVLIASLQGGCVAAKERMEDFLSERLDRYGEDRNKPGANGSSGFSPYLHFGHLGAHTVFRAISEQEGWTMADLSTKPTGKRHGWWNMSDSAESFLDELITWREIGYNMAHREPDTYTAYSSLPGWALETLADHEDDPREHVYTLEEFEQAKTHDELWNAAQNQLVREGTIHNYMRMLWGKKILHWSARAEDALETMIYLNNKYALDGRDPNSYSGIFWTLGRYDRGWTEREIFGKVRYMTSASTRRKYKVNDYIATYTGGQNLDLFASS